MRKNFHFAEHIYTLMIYLLLVPVVNFYAGSFFGGLRIALCAFIGIGILVYKYRNWDYDLTKEDRCSLREFLIGILPAQIIHVLFYILLYLIFALLWYYKLFQIFPFGNIATSTFVLGLAYVWIGSQIYSLSLTSLGCVMSLVAVSVVIYTLISYICYIRGVFLRERYHYEMMQGIQRKKPEPFAKRYRFVPLVNILPVFSFLRRHFFSIEYKIRPALFLLIFLFVARLLYNGLCVWLWSLLPNFYFYYSLKLIGIYLLGIIVSSIELHDNKI
jgi:hypothetical protein